MSEQFERSEAAPAGGWQAVAGDLAHCVRFYSRLPVPALPWEQDAHALPNFPRLVRVIPLAGLLLGLVPASTMIVALLLDLGPWLSAMLAVAAMVLATGALHEDGLADVADSFGATTRTRVSTAPPVAFASRSARARTLSTGSRSIRSTGISSGRSR